MEFRYYLNGDKEFVDIDALEFLEKFKRFALKNPDTMFNHALNEVLHDCSRGEVPLLADYQGYDARIPRKTLAQKIAMSKRP